MFWLIFDVIVIFIFFTYYSEISYTSYSILLCVYPLQYIIKSHCCELKSSNMISCPLDVENSVKEYTCYIILHCVINGEYPVIEQKKKKQVSNMGVILFKKKRK